MMPAINYDKHDEHPSKPAPQSPKTWLDPAALRPAGGLFIYDESAEFTGGPAAAAVFTAVLVLVFYHLLRLRFAWPGAGGDASQAAGAGLLPGAAADDFTYFTVH